MCLEDRGVPKTSYIKNVNYVSKGVHDILRVSSYILGLNLVILVESMSTTKSN